MKKSLLSCILSFALLLSLLPATVLAAEPSLKVSATSVNAGDEVTVTYTVPNKVEAGSVSLEIYFDTAYFQVKSIVPATITDASSSTSEPATSSAIGKVTMAALNPVGDPFTIPAGTVLVTIVFVAKAGSGGSSSITVGTAADIIKAVDDSNLDIAAGVDNTPAAITVNAAPPAPVEYTVTFHVNGGSGTIPPQTTSGQKLASLPTASRAGYRFDGWYTAASGGSEITTAHVYAANTTLYAHWTSVGGSTGGKTSRYSGPSAIDMPMLYRGCTGDAVKTLQGELNAKGYDCGSVDGIFGGKTYAAVTAFQKANSLSVDGIVGKLTWGKLYDAAPVTVMTAAQPTVSYGSSGEAVRKLQELLNARGYDCGSVDGIFGAKTKAAVQAFQEANSLASDGIAGPLTWSKLG